MCQSICVFQVALHHNGCIYCCCGETSCLVLIPCCPWEQDNLVFYYWYRRVHTSRDWCCKLRCRSEVLLMAALMKYEDSFTCRCAELWLTAAASAQSYMFYQDRAGCVLTHSCLTVGKVDWSEICHFTSAMNVALSLPVCLPVERVEVK